MADSSPFVPQVVKRRRKRRLAAIFSGAAFVGASSLVIVAFLGRYVGSFTVGIDSGTLSLSMSKKKAFTDPTTFLSIRKLPSFTPTMYGTLVTDYPDSDATKTLDQEETLEADCLHEIQYVDDTSTEVSNIRSIGAFKYTFFVKNTGTKDADFKMDVKITENNPSSDQSLAPAYRDLSNSLRVMLYSNFQDDDHNKTVYAKAADTYHKLDPSKTGVEDTEANHTFDEYISTPNDDSTVTFDGFATKFLNDTDITSINVQDFVPDQMVRYTMVTWIEGNDPQCGGSAPVGASLKLGIQIKAVESTKA